MTTEQQKSEELGSGSENDHTDTHRLGDLIDTIGGGTPKTDVDEYWGGDNLWLTPSEVSDEENIHVSDTDRKLTNAGLSNTSAKILPPGSVLMTSRATVGVPVINTEPMATNQGFIGIKIIDEDQLNNYYLLYWLKNKKSLIMNHASGSTYPEISQRSFNELQIELPPVRKQIGIASILRTLDEKIEVNNQINEDLEAMAQSLFSSWFVDLINYDGETEYDEEFERDVPKAWEKASLDDIAEFLNGKAWKDYSSENGEENDLPVVKIKELRSGISDDSDEVVRSECPIKYILDDGDIVFSWSASLVLDLWSEGDAFLNQHLFKVTSQNYPRWFCYLWIDHHIRLFRHIAEAKKTTMGHIKRSDLEEAKVLIPPEEKIKEMSEKMKPIFEKRVKTQVENGYLEELRDTLLPKLMSGEIRVNDLELDELGVDSEV